MSSLSHASAPAATAVPIDLVRRLALAPLLAFVVLVQLDAIGNRLSAALPIKTNSILLGLIVAGTALILLHPRPGTPRAIGTDGARLIALLACWVIVAWALSAHHQAGADYLVRLASAILPALCLLVIVDTPARLRLMLHAIVAAGLVAAVIVIVESRTGTRIVSTALAATTADFDGVARSAGGSDENPTTAAQMLLVSTMLAIGLVAAGERRFRLILLGMAALGTVALALTSARSAILGLGAGLALIAWTWRGRAFFPILVIGGIVAAIGAIPFLPPTLIERFAAIGDFAQDQTLYRRITYLRIGVDLIGQSPVWGVGPGNYPLYYLDDAYRYLPGRWPIARELHNTYLDTAAEYGLVGLAIFAALIAHAHASALRGARAVDAVLRHSGFATGAALAALLVACFFMPHKDLRYLWLMLALAIQCGRIAAGSPQETPR